MSPSPPHEGASPHQGPWMPFELGPWALCNIDFIERDIEAHRKQSVPRMALQAPPARSWGAAFVPVSPGQSVSALRTSNLGPLQNTLSAGYPRPSLSRSLVESVPMGYANSGPGKALSLSHSPSHPVPMATLRRTAVDPFHRRGLTYSPSSWGSGSVAGVGGCCQQVCL